MINIDWAEVSQYVDWIYREVDDRLKRENQSLSSVIGLVRGGLIPAVMLSHRFNVRMVPLQWQTRDQDRKTDVETLTTQVIQACNHDTTILIVDDIVDSGKTIRDIRGCISRYLRKLPPGGPLEVNVIYAFLVKKLDLEFDTISGIEIRDDRWVVFPWEVKK